jgi:putative peptide zinc metalloprotease protein
MNLEQVAAAVRSARAEAGRARENGDLAGFRAREAEANALEERRSFLEAELERTVLRAPTRGVVLTEQVERRAGQRLERGDTFLDLADLSTVEVEARVPEEDVDAVKLGARTRVKVYAYPERTFRGEVSRIAPRADDRHAFRVLVRVANPDGALRSGMTGSARIGASWRPFLWRPLAPLVRWLRFKLWV